MRDILKTVAGAVPSKRDPDVAAGGMARRTAFDRYGIALLAVAAAVLGRIALDPIIGRRSPFFGSIFAVVFAAAYGGRGPGLMATAFSVIITGYVLASTHSDFFPGDLGAAVVIPFGALGVAITLIVDRLHTANEKLRRSAEELKSANDSLQASQRELTAANARFKQSNQELEAFAYAVSHDLQSPLRTIGTFSQILAGKKRSQPDPETAELLAGIEGGVKRMSRFVSDLLQYSTEAHVDADHVTEIDCNRLFAEVLEDGAKPISESEAVVTSDPLPRIQGDPARISQVFTNLIGNALKYRSPEIPRVHVSATMRDGYWVFSFRDNGVGFDNADAERIFKVFERLPGTCDRGGTGIGLAIVKRIVERHGGSVWAESKPGDGATFYFKLPK